MTRNLLLSLIRAVGSGVGVRPLRRIFPEMGRGEVLDLLKRYRKVEQEARLAGLKRLEWLIGGAVWAMDFTKAPSLVDGVDPSILAVRDLGSRRQLLWRSVPAEDAGQVVSSLERLFGEHGRPLVIKSDNGPAFQAEETMELLHRSKVSHLLSPPRRPAYNGSVEAQIRWMKVRTGTQVAARRGAICWTGDDLERAALTTNALYAKPPSTPLSEELRAEFRKALRAEEGRIETETGTLDPGGRRKAIRRALVARGILKIRRRRITPLLKSFFRAEIS